MWRWQERGQGMQLFFTIDELKLLVDIVEHRDRELREEMSTHPEQIPALSQKRDCCARLLDRIVVRDFGFGYDELQDMVEMLTACRASFRSELAKADEANTRVELEKRNHILEHMLDKVTEACAMA
jgi:hypothetical protein